MQQSIVPLKDTQKKASRRFLMAQKHSLLSKDIIDIGNEQDLDVLSLRYKQFIMELLNQEERNKQELQILERAFSSLQFFQEKRAVLGPEVYLSLFKRLGHRHFPKESIVFNYGEEGDTFYIVLRGKVTVCLPKQQILKQLQEGLITHQTLMEKLAHNKIKYYGRKANKKFKGTPKVNFDSVVERLQETRKMSKSIHMTPLTRQSIMSPSMGQRRIIIAHRNTIMSPASRSRNFSLNQKPAEPKQVTFRYPHVEIKENVLMKYSGMLQHSEQDKHSQQEKTPSVRSRNASGAHQIEQLKLSIFEPKLEKKGTLQSEVTSSRSSDESNQEDNAFDEYMKFVFADYNQVKEIGTGQAFGEIALVTRQKRTATIVCEEDCDFITLTRDSFTKILGESETMIMQKNINFFRSFDCFERVPRPKMMSIIHQMTMFTPRLYQTIYRENEVPEKVYFILEGEVEIQQVNLNESRALLKSNAVSDTVSMSVLTKGSMFGHEEILKGTYRTSRAICRSTNTQIYQLGIDTFLSVLKMYPVSSMWDNSLEKIDNNRNERIRKSIQIKMEIQQDLNNSRKNSLSYSSPKLIDHVSRFKIANDTQLLCDAKQNLEQRIKSNSITSLKTDGSLRSILNPVDHRKKKSMYSTEFLVSKDSSTTEFQTAETSQIEKPVEVNTRSHCNTPRRKLKKLKILAKNSVLSPLERMLLTTQDHLIIEKGCNQLSQISVGQELDVVAFSRTQSNVSLEKQMKLTKMPNMNQTKYQKTLQILAAMGMKA